MNDFVNKYSKLASIGTLGSPIFPSVVMAQAIIESGWGKDPTATQANNFFGIKDSSDWKGPVIRLATPNDANKVSSFRVYDDPAQSFRDHIDFLYQNPRYTSAGVFTATTPEDQAQAISNAHYAEAYGYGNTLISLINQYNLKQLDQKKN